MLPAGRLLVMLLALVLIVGLLLFVQYTKIGRAMRALAQDREVTPDGCECRPNFGVRICTWGDHRADQRGHFVVHQLGCLDYFLDRPHESGSGARSPLVGGYAGAILATRYGVSFWLCLPLSGLISAALGALVGWPVLRLKGVYFAMTTLSLTEAIRLLALNGGDITKGATGLLHSKARGDRHLQLIIVP